MFEFDEFGSLVFVPPGMCFAEDDGGGDGGGSSDGGDSGGSDEADAGASNDGGQDTVAAGQDTQLGSDSLDGGAADDWRSGIQDEKARKFASSFTSPADMAAEALKQRQKLSNAIVRPGKDASDEDIAAFHKSLGVPESSGDYKVTLPDNLPEHLKPANDEGLNGYRDFAHQNHFTQEQFDANLKWYFGELAKNESSLSQSFDQARQESMDTLRREWGKDADTNVELAVRAAEELGGNDFLDFVDNVEVDGVKLGDHPAFLKPWAKIGRLMSEDNPLMGMPEDAVADLHQEHRDLTGKILDARDRGDKTEVERLTRQRDAINARLGPGKPMVGRQGRAR